MRRSRVIACFASSTQQMNSLRAKGVMSLQAASAVELAISASRRSTGSLCTTPPGTRLLVTQESRSARAIGSQAVRSPTVARPRHRDAGLGRLGQVEPEREEPGPCQPGSVALRAWRGEQFRAEPDRDFARQSRYVCQPCAVSCLPPPPPSSPATAAAGRSQGSARASRPRRRARCGRLPTRSPRAGRGWRRSRRPRRWLAPCETPR